MKRFNVLQIVIISIFVMITINLNAQKTAIVLQTGRTNTYTVFSIPYNPPFPFTGGTPVSVNTDDVYSGVITLPFNFCFYGQEYNQVIVGSNGVISFDLTNAGGYCPWSFSDFVPSNALPLNSIFGAYLDIDPVTCGNLYYDITGTSPNRKFVFKCNQVCYFSCSSLQTSQEIVLYEGSNVIEVYIEGHPACTGWNSGNAIIGIQDATGTTGVAAPDRNTGPWTAYNEAWRFTGSPDACNSQTCQFDSITIQNQTCGTDNEFTLNGSIYFSISPDSSTLIVTDQISGISQTIQPPLTNPINFTINNIPFSTQPNSINISLMGLYNCYSIINYNPPALVTLNSSFANPSCGASNGAAVVNIIANGIPNYSYQWSSGQSTTNTASTTNFINAIPAGVYVVTVTNGNGCTSSTTINLNDNVSFTANISPQNPISCFGQCNGSVIVSLGGSSQNPPFNYNWSNGQSHLGDTLNTDTVNSLCAGLVAVTITDNNGCNVVASILMNEPSAINVNVSSTNPTCSGFSNGSASVSVSGGITPYSYMWNTSPIQFTQTVNNLIAGTYLVSVTDANGCNGSATVTIVDPQPSQAGYTYSANGLTVNFSNTSSAGTYNWDFGNGFSSTLQNPIFTYSTAGTYNVCLSLNSQCGNDVYCQNITVTLVNLNNVITNNIEIYPNPATDKLNIIFPETPKAKVSVKLFDNIGQKILEFEFANKINEIDLKSFADGMYYIKVETKNGDILRKIVINKK